MKLVTIKDVYNMFNDTNFCETQNVRFEVRVFEDYAMYDDFKYTAEHTFSFYAMYHNESFRKSIFERFKYELDATSIETRVDKDNNIDDIIIICDYVKDAEYDEREHS